MDENIHTCITCILRRLYKPVKPVYGFPARCLHMGSHPLHSNMIRPEITKTCQECGDRIAGRADKKFCSDHCRVAFHNRLNSDATNYVRNVNNILRKNRRILAELNTKGKVKVAVRKLIDRGFEFGYFTSVADTADGATCRYCYDQGYQPIEEDVCLLIVREEQ